MLTSYHEWIKHLGVRPTQEGLQEGACLWAAPAIFLLVCLRLCLPAVTYAQERAMSREDTVSACRKGFLPAIISSLGCSRNLNWKLFLKTQINSVLQYQLAREIIWPPFNEKSLLSFDRSLKKTNQVLTIWQNSKNTFVVKELTVLQRTGKQGVVTQWILMLRFWSILMQQGTQIQQVKNQR